MCRFQYIWFFGYLAFVITYLQVNREHILIMVLAAGYIGPQLWLSGRLTNWWKSSVSFPNYGHILPRCWRKNWRNDHKYVLSFSNICIWFIHSFRKEHFHTSIIFIISLLLISLIFCFFFNSIFRSEALINFVKVDDVAHHLKGCCSRYRNQL